MQTKSLSSFLAAVVLAMGLGAQSQPSLQITSPSSGTIVNPGQTFTVSITSSGTTTFQSLFTIAKYPIGISTNATSTPAQVSVAIPLDIDCGIYSLMAEGIITPGQIVYSPSISIDVERPDLPTKLTASPRSLIIESLGEQTSVELRATFADNSVLHVTQSTLLTYSSSNTSVATVDSSGKITAVGPGNSWVTVTYTVGGQSLPLIVPVTVQNPMVNVSPTSLTFGSQPAGTSSTPLTVTLTNAFTSNVAIQRITVTDTSDFSETDNCIASSPLTPGNGCTVNVTFSPTAGGTRAGTLNIKNSGNIVPISVYLTGTATIVPYITSLSPTSGSVGTSVTITGANFGATQGTSTVTFNGTAATPTSWSATSIAVPVPTGATTGNVVVTVGGTASNGVSFTVSAAGPPNITSLSPTSGPVGTSVTITGTNFGATQGSSTVTFNGTAATPTSWSATSIAVTVPAGATTGNVVVTVGGVASNGMTFTVTSTSGNIVYVQHASTDAGTTTSATLAFHSNNTVGNLIAVVIRAGSSSSQVLNVEDSNGNTYRQAFQLGITANPVTFAIYYAENIKGGANTIEVSDTVSGPLRFAILEYSGVATANSLDVTATAQGTSTSPNSGNATTTASGDLLVGEVVTNNTATFTAGTSYTIKELVPAEPSTKLIAEDQIQTTAGAASASASLAASDNWGAGLAAFKAVGRAGPLVQHTGTDAGTTTTSSLAFVSPNTAGNLIAVCVRGGNSSSQVFTITDSNSNTYRQAAQLGFTSSAATMAIYYAENIKAGANTITVSDTVSGPLRFAILEYSGIATSNSLDVTAMMQGNSASPNSGNLTTTANSDLLLSIIATTNTATFTVGSGYTIEEFVPAEPNTKLIVEDQLQRTAGSASASASLAASDNWGAVLAAFRPR